MTAATAVTNLIGLKAVDNNIIIDSGLGPLINKEIIKRTLKNDVTFHTASITVEVSVNEVPLESAVDSRYQKELAEKITWKTPGVRNIKSNLKVTAEHIDKTLNVFIK